MSVHEKLMQARVDLSVTPLKKSGLNKFAGYDYFELGDFLPTVQAIFARLRLSGVVSYTKELATLTITDMDDNSTIVITSPMGSAALKGCHEVQNIGAVETYQRRYLWVTAMEIVEHDALDATVGKDKPQSFKSVAQADKETLTDEQSGRAKEIADCVRAELNEKGSAPAAVLWKAETSNEDATLVSAAWGLLASDERSAIKKAGQERKAA